MPRRKMSVTQLTLLTSLSMMGAGIIMLPAKFAEIGAISMLSWIVTALASGAVAYFYGSHRFSPSARLTSRAELPASSSGLSYCP